MHSKTQNDNDAINQKPHEICPSCVAVASLMEQQLTPMNWYCLVTTLDSLDRFCLKFEQTLVNINCNVYLKFTLHPYDLCFRLMYYVLLDTVQSLKEIYISLISSCFTTRKRHTMSVGNAAMFLFPSPTFPGACVLFTE